MLRDHRVLQRFTYTSGLLAIVLLLLPMVPGLGATINGARIWIHVGPFSFQPGEVAKLLLVVAFAGYLVLHRDALALAGRRVLFVDLPRGRDLGPILLMWLVSLGVLVFQRDLGSSLLFFGLFLIMLYVATERAGWLVVGGALFLGGALLAYRLFGHVQIRVDTWLHPFDYYSDADGAKSFQLVESMFGMGWGGLLGRGLGNGMPAAHPPRRVRLHHRRDRRGARADRRHRGDLDVRPDRRARPPASLICRDGFGKLMAVGLGQRRGPPGVRGRRRRHPADPADRAHHAVPVLRRLVAGRQLGARSRCCCASPTTPAARALAGHRGRRRPGGDPGGEVG